MTETTKTTTATTTNPWHYTTVTANTTGGISVRGFNHYTGEPLSWSLNYHCFEDPDFVSRRISFKGASWGPGARLAFLNLIARARRERGLPARFFRPGDLVA